MNQVQWHYAIKLTIGTQTHISIYARFNNEGIFSYGIEDTFVYRKNESLKAERIENKDNLFSNTTWTLTKNNNYKYYKLRVRGYKPDSIVYLSIPQDVLEALWNELKEVCNEYN